VTRTNVLVARKMNETAVEVEMQTPEAEVKNSMVGVASSAIFGESLPVCQRAGMG